MPVTVARMATGAAVLAMLAQAGCSNAASDLAPGDTDDMAPFAQIAPEDRLRLTGTEPFWGGEITGETLQWSTPDLPDGVAIPVTRFAGRGGLSFSGELEGAALDIAIVPGECSDGMSDRNYPFFAVVQIGSAVSEGCAWRDGVDDIGEP